MCKVSRLMHVVYIAYVPWCSEYSVCRVYIVCVFCIALCYTHFCDFLHVLFDVCSLVQRKITSVILTVRHHVPY